MPGLAFQVAEWTGIPVETLGVLLGEGGPAMDQFLQFFGRLHPSTVHFPVALVVIAALAELVSLGRGSSSLGPLTKACIWGGAGTAVLATACGWVHADQESHLRLAAVFSTDVEQFEDHLALHRWLSVALSSVMVSACLLLLCGRHRPRAWIVPGCRGAVFSAAILMLISGHLGGEITHGKGWVFQPFQPGTDVSEEQNGDAVVPGEEEIAGSTEPPVPGRSVDYLAHVRPIILDRCNKCHGPEKQKGDLQLEPIARAFPEGDESLWVIQPGKPDESELMRRILLPRDDDDAMPPKGDLLTDVQKTLLAVWIEEGADQDPIPGFVPPPDITAGDEPGEQVEVAPTPDPDAIALEAHEAAVSSIASRGGRVARISRESSALEVNFSLARPPIDDDDLEMLSGLEATLERLNISRSGISDKGLLALEDLVHLQYLNLSETEISDKGLVSIEHLDSLAYLNLFGTSISDAGLVHINGLSMLQSLHLWRTDVTLAGAEELQALIPGLRITGLIDPVLSPIDEPDITGEPAGVEPAPVEEQPAPAEEESPPGEG